jgi:protease-4
VANKDNSIISILSTPLRIREDKALPILTAYSSFLDAVKEGSSEKQIDENVEQSQIKIYEFSSDQSECDSFEDFKDFKETASLKSHGVSSFSNVSAGSIAVIPVRGVMMRETTYSYRYGYIIGTRELESILTKAENSDNIDGIVIQLKSPGGEAAGNESLARVIQRVKKSKPVLVSFEGMASAALEAFISSTEIYALEKDSYFGSLGTMTTLVNDSKFWSDMGVDFIEIYAPQSSLKNIESREAKNGNSDPMKDRLKKSTKFFIDDVKKARPQIKDDDKIFKGAIYNAVEALAIDAIDGIKDFNYVLNRTAFLARKSKRANTKKVSLENKNKETETVQVSKEDKNLLDRAKAFFGGGTKEAAPEKTEHEIAIEKATSEISGLKTAALSYQKQIAELEADKAKTVEAMGVLEADVAHLSDAKLVDGEEPFGTVEAMVKVYNQTFEHNKELGGQGKNANLPVNNKEQESGISENKIGLKTESVDDAYARIQKNLKEKKAETKE